MMIADVGKTGTSVGLTSYQPFTGISVGPAVSLTGSVRLEPEGTVSIQQELCFLVQMLRQEDGGYVAHVPILPSASTQGATFEEAIQKIRENLEGLLEDVAHGELALLETPEFIEPPEPENLVTLRLRHP